MSSARILVALFILAALGGGYYYIDVYTAGKQVEEGRISSNTLNITSENVLELSISKPGKETIGLKKVKGVWEIVEPVNDKADKKTLKALLLAAENMSAKDIVGKVGDLDLKEFGLDNPKVATFKLKDESIVKLLVGGLNPAGARYYSIGKSPDDVVLTEKAKVEKIFRSFYVLRDKTLFPFTKDKVAQISLRRGDLNITITRKSDNDRWSIVNPIKADADNMEVNNMLRSFVEARVAGFIEEKVADLAQYGLDTPGGQIVLSDRGEEVALLLGGKTKSGGRYAKLTHRANVVRISEDLLALLPSTIDKLRDRALIKIDVGAVKKVVNIRSDEVYAIEVERNGQIFKTSRGDDGYTLEKPERRKLEPDAWNRLVWTVLGLEYIEKIDVTKGDKIGVAKANLKILLYNAKGGIINGFTVGELADKKQGYYVKRSDADNLYKVDPAFVTDQMVKALEGLIKE